MPGSRAVTGAWLGTFAANLLGQLSGFATGILLARFLLPEGRGILAAITFWPDLLWGISLVGLPDAIAHRVAKGVAPPRSCTMTAVILALGLGSIVALVSVPLLPLLLGPERREWWPLAQAYALIYLPILSVMTSLLAIDRGQFHLLQYNIWRVTRILIYCLILLILFTLSLGRMSNILIAIFLSVAIPCTALLFIRFKTADFVFIFDEIKAISRTAIQFQGTCVLNVISIYLDHLIMILFWDNVEIGLYVVALRWASSGLNIVTSSFSTILLPQIAAGTGLERQREMLARALRYASLLLASSTIVMALPTPWLLPMLFGASFQPAVPVALVLVVAHLPLALRQIIVHGLRGLGESRHAAAAEAITILIFLICVWPATQTFGLTGFGLAMLVANSASLLFLLHHLRRRLGLRPADWYGFDLTTSIEVIRIGRNWLMSTLGR